MKGRESGREVFQRSRGSYDEEKEREKDNSGDGCRSERLAVIGMGREEVEKKIKEKDPLKKH